MSSSAKQQFAEEPISEAAVKSYLRDHPDFFERNGALLSALQVPHGSGEAVSLVERQVSVLRQKELKLERQLKELVSVARANDALATKIHALALGLLATDSLQNTINAIEDALRSGFGADQSVLVHFGDASLFDGIDGGRFFRVIDREDDVLLPFATFLNGRGPRCGQGRDSQRAWLFQGDADEIGSMALVPLGDKAQLGFLAIGSAEADRFHPGMSIDFLARVGELIAAALERY